VLLAAGTWLGTGHVAAGAEGADQHGVQADTGGKLEGSGEQIVVRRLLTVVGGAGRVVAQRNIRVLLMMKMALCYSLFVKKSLIFSSLVVLCLRHTLNVEII
jgi:hypothetical protein